MIVSIPLTLKKDICYGLTEIVVIALDEDRTMISKDSDFSDHYYLKGAPPKILLLQFGNISNNELIEYFKNYFEFVVDAFQNGSDHIQFGRNGIMTN